MAKKEREIIYINFILILNYCLNGRFVKENIQIRYIPKLMFENPTVNLNALYN